MNMGAVLIITDNLESAGMLAHGLEKRGVRVDTVAISSSLQRRDDITRYSLVIIDTDKTDGVVLCRQLRADYHNPLLFLTYERDERYHLMVYDAGVDDCIQKPIGNALFLAKVDVWLRAAHHAAADRDPPPEGFHLHPDHRYLALPDGKTVKLTLLEVRLLELFFANPNTVLETDTIIRRVWTDYCEGDSVLLKNLVYRLRRKIEPDPHEPHYIQTVFGGYMFCLEDVPVHA